MPNITGPLESLKKPSNSNMRWKITGKVENFYSQSKDNEC
jgi:hypothetical protein